MSHISKGDVHAYLDGGLGAYSEEAARYVREHLDTCRECAQSLDDEKRLRKEASAILAASAQGPVELDPLQELLARASAIDGQGAAEGAEGAERTGRPRPTLVRRMYALRWAATVVISLGAGWLARDLSAPVGDVERVGFIEPAVTEIGVRSADDQEAQDPMARENTGRLSEAETPAESPSAVALGGDERRADRGAGEFDNDAVQAQVEPALDQVESLLDEVVSVPARQRVESTITRGVGPADVDVRARAVQPLPAEPAQVEARSLREELGRSAPAVDLRDAASVSNIGGGAALNRATIATTPFLVPGLPVREVRLAQEADVTTGGQFGAVVVTQELEDGRTVELRFVPLTSGDPELARRFQERNDLLSLAQPEGWRMVFRDVPGGTAVLSGPLTEPELAELLERALGPR